MPLDNKAFLKTILSASSSIDSVFPVQCINLYLYQPSFFHGVSRNPSLALLNIHLKQIIALSIMSSVEFEEDISSQDRLKISVGWSKVNQKFYTALFHRERGREFLYFSYNWQCRKRILLLTSSCKLQQELVSVFALFSLTDVI